MNVHRYITVSLTGLLCACLLQGCTGMRDTADREQLFRGKASFGKLVPAVRQSPLVTYCRPATVDSVDYGIRQFPATAASGRQSLLVTERVQGITGMTASATGEIPMGLPGIDDWENSRGQIVSCGGLLTLAFSEVLSGGNDSLRCDDPLAINGARLGSPNRRYALTQVSDYSGELFPLRVGNVLSFGYTALLRSWSGQTVCSERRFRMQTQYTVLSANDKFAINGRPVPGRVYLVERTLTDTDSGERVLRDYYYSADLGWVVMAVDYVDGMPGMVRELATGDSAVNAAGE